MMPICKCGHPEVFHRSNLKDVPCDFQGKCASRCQSYRPRQDMDFDLCPNCGDSLGKHPTTHHPKGVTFLCPSRTPIVSSEFERLRQGMIVQVTERDRNPGIYRVEEVFRSGFRASLMGEHASKDFTEFRIEAYRNHEGYEWFGIAGLTILDEATP